RVRVVKSPPPCHATQRHAQPQYRRRPSLRSIPFSLPFVSLSASDSPISWEGDAVETRHCGVQARAVPGRRHGPRPRDARSVPPPARSPSHFTLLLFPCPFCFGDVLDPAAEKTPEGGGGAGAACPLWRRSLPHVCVTTVTSFLFGYHTGLVNEPLESISTDLGGRVRGVAVAVDDAVRDCRVLQRHIVGRLGGRRRQRRVGRRPCGAADRACRVRRVAARQPQG
uniref:Uncharacterized protein n=1 Tax=Aegilops tauschii subsp. strangulata TaxID=200361 RepID=A0A453RCA9_AEGTS